MPPSADYDVEVYDVPSNSWKEAESTLLCYNYLENDKKQSSYKDCNLHVQAEAKPHHMTFMKVKSSNNGSKEDSSNSDLNEISTSDSNLTYKGQSDGGAS